MLVNTMIGINRPSLSMDNLFCFVSVLVACFGVTYTETTIRTTAPVSPVEEGAILSIHCEVFSLEENHQVVLYRLNNGKTTTLSYGEGVAHDVDERVFLAVRQQIDGSTVYFLSIMDVSRNEGGEYFCKVMNVAAIMPSSTPVSSISLDVTFFPSDVDPVCSPKEPPVVNIGDVITLNCSSAKAYPTVAIGWTRTGNDESLMSTQTDVGKRVYAVLKVTVRASDNKAVYLCGITSQSYPTRKQTCHVGPLVVLGVKDDDIAPPTWPKSTEKDIFKPVRPIHNPEPKPNDPIDLSTECSDICVASESSLFFWVIATCVAGILAFVFLIVGIFLFIKFSRLPGEMNETYISTTHHPVDKVYDELETRRLEHQSMYMSLDKARKAELQSVYPTCES
ncbi:uncharacterized protein [Amphiura filiformis]|uniref:uncharacterized protein n=1 Tax=Amphiura filiformis TaxID=82378 RepID=UPI003B217D78